MRANDQKVDAFFLDQALDFFPNAAVSDDEVMREAFECP
jgi:hypothetical protein